MATTLGGVLIHSDNPRRLRDWYAKGLGDGDGGSIGDSGFGLQVTEDQYFLFFAHEDVSGSSREPARIIVNLNVDDADAVAARFDALGARWIRPLEDGGPGRIGTLADPDGNYLQIVQNTPGS